MSAGSPQHFPFLLRSCFGLFWGSILYKVPQSSRCGPFQSELRPKAPAKRSQHVNATYRNVVGSNMLHPFGHPFLTCCVMLWGVGCCWLKFENGQIFHSTFVDVAWCCSRLARFVQQCCARVCALSFIFNAQHVTTRRKKVVKRVQHVAPNNVEICCVQLLRLFGWSWQMLSQQCWDMLCWNVAIVWLRRKN